MSVYRSVEFRVSCIASVLIYSLGLIFSACHDAKLLKAVSIEVLGTINEKMMLNVSCEKLRVLESIFWEKTLNLWFHFNPVIICLCPHLWGSPGMSTVAVAWRSLPAAGGGSGGQASPGVLPIEHRLSPAPALAFRRSHTSLSRGISDCTLTQCSAEGNEGQTPLNAFVELSCKLWMVPFSISREYLHWDDTKSNCCWLWHLHNCVWYQGFQKQHFP